MSPTCAKAKANAENEKENVASGLTHVARVTFAKLAAPETEPGVAATFCLALGLVVKDDACRNLAGDTLIALIERNGFEAWRHLGSPGIAPAQLKQTLFFMASRLAEILAAVAPVSPRRSSTAPGAGHGAGKRHASAAYEPGSGSTLMGYTGYRLNSG